MEDLSTGRFCVLTLDFIRLPLDSKEQRTQDENIVELLTEGGFPADGKWDLTIEAAIERHDQDFGNDWSA